jgi:hypothetical protein
MQCNRGFQMAGLNFDLRAYIFQEGVKVLRTSYGDAENAVKARLAKVLQDAEDYQASLRDGEGWIGERTDDGHVIWDHEGVLEMQAEKADEALQSLRKAFVISTYHQWERSARWWTASPPSVDSHLKLVGRVVGAGIRVDSRLSAVRDLSNLLKHGNARCGRALRASWPELLHIRWRQGHEPSDWYEAVRLDEAHVHEVLDIVSASGPWEVVPGLSSDSPPKLLDRGI